MPSHAYRKRDGRLEPADERSAHALARVRDGECVLVEMKRLRNQRHHAKFFAMLQMIFENQSRYRTLDDMLDAVKAFVGHTKTVRMRDGREIVIVKSIAWNAMDQSAFESFYERVVDVVVTEIIPNVKREDLARQLKEITGMS